MDKKIIKPKWLRVIIAVLLCNIFPILLGIYSQYNVPVTVITTLSFMYSAIIFIMSAVGIGTDQ
jgi:hypothetical protein